MVGSMAVTPPVGQAYAYSITAGNTGDAFAIDPVTGLISVKRGTLIDFETAPNYSLTIQVRESGGAVATTTATINVIDLAEPTAQIIDNGTTGFTTTGTWTTENVGRGGSELRALSTPTASTASWTFRGLIPGVYRLAATWVANVNRTTQAPYSILSSTGTVLSTKIFDQSQAPTDLSLGGSGWKMIDTMTVTGNDEALEVRLSSGSAAGFSIADAVRLDRLGSIPQNPEIDITLGGTSLVDGSSTIDFGTVTVGTLASRDLQIKNLSDGDLSVTAISLPAGFVLRNPLPVGLVLGPNEAFDFSVVYSATAVGIASGTLTVSSNDANEQPFHISLTAHAQAVVTPQALPRITVDGVEIPLQTGVIDFGSTTLGTPVSKSVRIENVGTGVLDYSNFNVQLMETTNYQISFPAGYQSTLAPGESTTFTLTYLANEPHLSRDRVSLNWTSDLGWRSGQPHNWDVNVRGTVPAGELSVWQNPTLSAAPAQSTTGVYAFKNTGDVSVTLQPATITGTDAARFTILSNFTAGLTVAPGATVNLIVQYTAGPVGRGEFATLNIPSNGIALPGISLHGISLAPEIQVTYFGNVVTDGVTNLNLGTYNQGQPGTPLEFVVQNVGTTNLTLQPVSVPAGFIVVQNFTVGQTLAPYQSAVLRIQPDVATLGTPSGTISFVNNDPDENPFDFQIQARVVAVPPAPEIDLEVSGAAVASGGSVDFGTSAGSTPRRTFRIRNTGQAPLTISQISSSSTAFRVLTSVAPGTPIAAGSGLDIEVEFLSAAAGAQVGQLTVWNNDSNEGAYGVRLTGVMQMGGQISIWDGPTDFTYQSWGYSIGSTPRGTALIKTLTIKNTSTSPLALGTATITGTGFTLLDSLPASVPAGGQFDFRVRYFNSQAASNSATLNLASSDSSRGPLAMTLNANAVALPEVTVLLNGTEIANNGTIDFGTIPAWQTVMKTITIRNDGVDSLQVYSPNLSTFGWSLLSAPTGTVAPGASLTWNIQRNGFPSGNIPATLSFSTNDFDEGACQLNLTGQVTPSGEIAVANGAVDFTSGVTVADFGFTRQGTPVTQAFVLSNLGPDTLSLGTPSIPAGYTLLDPWPATLAAGAQFNFRLRQDANSAAALPVNSVLFIPSSDLDEPYFRLQLRQTTHSVGEIEVAVDGVGIPQGGLVDFGTTAFGTPVTKTLSIRNVGPGSLIVSTIDNESLFDLPPGSLQQVTVLPGTSYDVPIRLLANAGGTTQGRLRILSNDTDEAGYDISLKGTVPPSGEIQVTSHGIDVPYQGTLVLPATLPGVAVTTSIVVTNLGTDNLLLNSASITGPFSIDTNLSPLQSLAPGASTTLILRGTPPTAGNYGGTLTIPNSDQNESPYTIGVTCNAVAEIRIDADGVPAPDNTGVVDFGSVVIGTDATRTMTLRNARATAVTLQPAIAPAGFTIVQNFTAGQNLPAGGTAQLIIQMQTSTKVFQSGQIAFQTSDSTQPVYDFRVMGNVIYSTVPVAPLVNGPTAFSLEEFSPRWTVPGRVSATDYNGDSITYSIVSGNPDDTLYVSPTGPDAGKIWVNKQDLTGLKHRGMFNLRIRATDNSTSSLFTDFDVQVYITAATASTRTDTTADGSVLDANGNGFGAGDTVNSTGTGILVQGGTNGSRGVLEFDLSTLPTNRVLKNAWLFFSTSALVGGATVSVPIDIYGYSGNGTIEAGDAALGTKIGTRPISNADGSNQLKVHSALLDAAYVRSLVGTGKLGLVLRNDGTSAGVVINASEAAVGASQRPYLALQFSDLKSDLVVRDVGATGTGNSLLTLTSNGTSFTVNTANVFGTGSWERFITGDFNGDGRSDIAGRDSSTGE